VAVKVLCPTEGAGRSWCRRAVAAMAQATHGAPPPITHRLLDPLQGGQAQRGLIHLLALPRGVLGEGVSKGMVGALQAGAPGSRESPQNKERRQWQGFGAAHDCVREEEAVRRPSAPWRVV